MKNLRILLLTLMFMPALAAFAQPGPLTVTNNSNCEMQVAAFSHVAGAAACMMFPAPVVCIPPAGGVAIIPAPGAPFDVWSLANVTSYLPSGCILCPSGVNTTSFLAPCGPNPLATPDGCGCNGGMFKVKWTAGNNVVIN
jgi:hypothetical protein